MADDDNVAAVERRTVMQVSGILFAGAGVVPAGATSGTSSDTSDEPADEPIPVEDATDLQAINDQPDADYELQNDIEIDISFTPIEDFSGTLDGNEHRIFDFGLDEPSSSFTALFETVTGDGTIKDLHMRGVDVTGDNYTAGLVAENQGEVKRCSVSGEVTSEYDGPLTAAYVGGLVGSNEGGLIEESFSTARVRAPNYHAGGFCGRNEGTIRDCYSMGDVTASHEAGGFTRDNWDVIETSFSTDIPASPGRPAGFVAEVGTSFGDSMEDCYWDEQAAGFGETYSDAMPLATDQMTGEAASDFLEGFDFDEVWATVEGGYPVLQSVDDTLQLDARPEQRHDALEQLAGDGSAADPYQLETQTDLLLVESDPIAFFTLQNDITLDDDVDTLGAFQGVFDGQQHTISGLTIDKPDASDVGFFTVLWDSALVQDLHLRDVDLTGDEQVGGVAGNNYGRIKRCSASGEVTAESGSTFTKVGGLVGEHSARVIEESFSTTRVRHVSSGRQCGGLVGRNDSEIRNCYALGDVTGHNWVGGFVGNNVDTIETSFSTDIVRASSDFGGFTGNITSTTMTTDCYWDEEAAAFGETAGEADGLPTAQMSGDDASTFLTGFDFETVWTTVDDGYPVLQSIDETLQLDARPEQRHDALPQLTGDGSAAEPYQIETQAGLSVVDSDPIAFVTLHDDIVLDDEFERVETFQGVFDGHHHVIWGLTIDEPEGSSPAGLFTRCEFPATVRRVHLRGVAVTGGDEVGALVGFNEGDISRCSTDGTVTTTGNEFDPDAGGLVGYHAAGLIEESFATAQVGDERDCGGLVGTNADEIANCYAIGDVVNGSTGGGFAGTNAGEIEMSYAASSVDIEEGHGGFAGDAGVETDCYWDTEASGTDETAGDATGRTTEEMTGADAPVFLSSFDFDEVWTTVEEPDDYPALQWEDQLEVEPPALPGAEQPPQDLNGDGLYEDIDGDGEFTIFDVQALFNNLESPIVQSLPGAFNFNEDENPTEVTIFDVQGLFNRLATQDE